MRAVFSIPWCQSIWCDCLALVTTKGGLWLICGNSWCVHGLGREIIVWGDACNACCLQWWLMLGYKCCDPLKGGQFSPWSVMECTCLLVSSFSLVLGWFLLCFMYDFCCFVFFFRIRLVDVKSCTLLEYICFTNLLVSLNASTDIKLASSNLLRHCCLFY